MVVGNGNIYVYSCNNCKYNARYEITDFTGQTAYIDLDNDNTTAIGLTRAGSSQMTCSFFSDNNCQNQFQSTGVLYWQTWECTAGMQSIGSIRYYYNT